MIRQRLILIIFICLLLAACRAEQVEPATPTPFPTPTAVAPALAAAQPMPITLTELMAEPSLYQNQPVQVTAQFFRQPRLVCGGLVTAYRSPASFVLREGEVALYGVGLGSGREVAPDGLTLTLNGRLLSWTGPVGCGKRAVVQQIWYIETSRIVSPQPLTNATLTPEVIIADVPEPPPADEPTATPTATPEPVLPAMTPTPTSTPTLTATPEAEEEEEEEPTPTPTATADSELVAQGELDSGNLVGARLEAGTVHEWRFAVRASDVLTLSVVADQGSLGLSLFDEAGDLLLEQADNPPLTVAAIENFALTEPGEYRLLVGLSAEDVAERITAVYHLLFMLSDSYTFAMQGLLEADMPENNISLRADSDHSWHIAGEAGQTIWVVVTPLDEMDPFIRLYDSAGDVVLDDDGDRIYINEQGPGIFEELIFTLPETGLYAIQIGDVDFAGGLYDILFLLE